MERRSGPGRPRWTRLLRPPYEYKKLRQLYRRRPLLLRLSFLSLQPINQHLHRSLQATQAVPAASYRMWTMRRHRPASERPKKCKNSRSRREVDQLEAVISCVLASFVSSALLALPSFLAGPAQPLICTHRRTDVTNVEPRVRSPCRCLASTADFIITGMTNLLHCTGTREFTANGRPLPRAVPCNAAFCTRCLFNRYGDQKDEKADNSDWVCPVCRLVCNCSVCRRKRGLLPTGVMAGRVDNAEASTSTAPHVRCHPLT